MYVISYREAGVVQHTATGTEYILATLKSGEWGGEMALFHDEPRGATVRTLTSVNALALDRSACKTFVAHIPPLREVFERMMQKRESAKRALRASARE
jgi:CRP-like cAMP-binding protein